MKTVKLIVILSVLAVGVRAEIKPNVLFIAIDDLRGAVGSAAATTWSV